MALFGLAFVLEKSVFFSFWSLLKLNGFREKMWDPEYKVPPKKKRIEMQSEQGLWVSTF